MYSPYSMNAEAVWDIGKLTVRFIDKPLIKLKDKLFPPSQQTLDKRLASYGNLYMFGFPAALDIAKDAIAKGAKPDNAILPKLDADWNNIGTETLLERAVRNGRKDALTLVGELIAAGANPAEALEKAVKPAAAVASLPKTAPEFNAAGSSEPAGTPANDTAAKPASKPANPAA